MVQFLARDAFVRTNRPAIGWAIGGGMKPEAKKTLKRKKVFYNKTTNQ